MRDEISTPSKMMTATMSPLSDSLRTGRKRPDPLRRMMPTPLVADLSVMGRTIRLETNNPSMLQRTQKVFARYPRAACGPPDFLWKIVCETGPHAQPPWPEIFAFSDRDLRWVSFGQHSFLAIDLAAKQAAGYLAEGLLADEAGFTSPFLTTLFLLTAGALRLTPLAGACVTLGEKAVLVLGMPNNGKTTSSYLAAKRGLDFYSDRAVFLDLDDGTLRVWGDFSPASFREETSQFLPELRKSGRPFHYRELTFLYVEEGTSIRSNGHPVVPVSCVFLERGAASAPRLTSLNSAESSRRLEKSLSFRDDERFETQRCAAFSALARVPACRLAYGNDPAVVAPFFRSLLLICDCWEGNRHALSPAGE